MYKYLYLFILIFFSGCSFSSGNVTKDNIENYTTKREYKDISKDAIFEAAKRVFIISGGNEFRIDSYRNNLQVSKTKFTHYPFYVYTTNDIWNISIKEENNTSYVKVNLKRIKDFDKETLTYLSKDLHELLLDRVEYLLGLRDSWPWCIGYMTLDDGICDVVDLEAYTTPTKDDMVKNILISERKQSKSLTQIDDILNDDVVLSLDNAENDILEKADQKIQENEEEDQALDDKILQLNDKVNTNIDKTLDNIEKNIEDE